MATKTSNTASAIISVLGMVVRRRTTHATVVATALLNYYLSPPTHWPRMRKRNYEKNLKVMLMSLFKCVILEGCVWTNRWHVRDARSLINAFLSSSANSSLYAPTEAWAVIQSVPVASS
jgi:hypothetical protein